MNPILKLVDLREKTREREREGEKETINETTTYKYKHKSIDIHAYVLFSKRHKKNSKFNKNESIIQRESVMVIFKFTFSSNSAFVYT
jgi:hypothetical protein